MRTSAPNCGGTTVRTSATTDRAARPQAFSRPTYGSPQSMHGFEHKTQVGVHRININKGLKWILASKNNPSLIAARSSLKSERFSPEFVPGSRCWDSVLWWPILGFPQMGPTLRNTASRLTRLRSGLER